jgi:hypothetical protein
MYDFNHFITKRLFLITGFPKKLLVAVSVVVIVAMCLRPAEAASIEHRRHRLHEHNMKTTKDMEAHRPEALLRDHRRRHQGSQIRNSMHSTKDGSRRANNDLYETAQIKIENKLAENKDNFDKRRKLLTETTKDYGSGITPWLPKTNFVNIHFHHYRISRKNDAAKSKTIVSIFILFDLLYFISVDNYSVYKSYTTMFNNVT